MNNPYLTELLARAAPIPKQFQTTFGHLSQVQFNWKPSLKQWSIGECVVHLITTNRVYMPLIHSVVEGRHRNAIISKVPGLSKIWGKLLLSMVSPEIKRKVKTLKAFEPGISTMDLSVLSDFDQLQTELINLITQSDSIDHRKTFITSPASKLITYSLRDTCNILIDHELRHYNQARTVMNNPAFPH